MKKILLLIISTFLISCTDEDHSDFNTNKSVEVGLKNDFTEYYWFNDKYKSYEPDSEILKELKVALEDISIEGFMGTWCTDSKREVPKFYKIMDAIEFTDFKMIVVDYSKKANGLEEGKNINFVPTFILYKNGKEIGRFIERTTKGSLENDLLQIAKGLDYMPYR